MRILAVVALTLATTACSHEVYSPPSQAFAMHAVRTLPKGQESLELEYSRHAAIFDPAINAGAGRIRVGVSADTEVSVEGTALAVEDSGPSRAARTLYAGRVGVRSNPGKTPFSFSAGAGGGIAPAGGTFAAVDGGIGVGYHNCVLVPTMQASVFVSQPLQSRPVDVSTDATAPPIYDTPRRTYGFGMRSGLRLSLTPSACRRGEPGTWLFGGVGATSVKDADSSSGYIAIGFGLEIPLE